MDKQDIVNKYNLVDDTHSNRMVINAMLAIKKHSMDNWIREFDESHGFLMSNHANISILQEELKDDSHSGASIACTLRMCQSLLTKEYNNELIVEDIENENEETPKTNKLEELNTKNTTEDIDNEAIEGSEKSYIFYDKMDNNKVMDYATARSLYG